MEANKAYCWQVTAITQSIAGEIKRKSEIWSFRVSHFGSDFHFQLIENLKLILGEDAIKSLFDKKGALKNHKSTGVIFNNGKSISIEELNSMTKQFTLKKVNIDGYSVK